jgi:LPS-assembly lipoprotein
MLGALVGLPAIGLAGCGFALRPPPKLSFSSIALTGFAARSPLAEALRRRLAQQVRVQDSPDRVDIVLHALEDVRERSVVATTSAAQVRELQLRVRFRFRAHTTAGRDLIPNAELLAARDLSFAEAVTLAKEYEGAELFRAMQDDIVWQVLRRLAAVEI